MKLEEAFIGEASKLRSGWRFAIFVAAFVIILTLLALCAFPFLPLDIQRKPLLGYSINAGLALAAALLGGWLCGRFLEKLPFSALGAAFSRSWLVHLILGAIVGAATLSFAVLIAAALGGLRFAPTALNSDTLSASLISFGVIAIAAASEEALFRGYILQTFVRSDLSWFAIIVTAIGFGSMHLANPNADLISTANTILAGIWFGVAYLRTRDLWFAWGMHLMWNWMQGTFFGIEISGVTSFSTSPIFREIDSGPTWLTGSTYGIEGGIAATIALAASSLIIFYLSKNHGNKSEPTA